MPNKGENIMTENKAKITTIRLTVAALFMAMNIAMSSFGVPVPGGHLYLCDIVICTAALLLNPFEAFLVGGIGSFLGDMIFYPTPMFVSLVVRGLQALAISLIVNKMNKRKRTSGIIGVAVGAVIMVVGYTLGKIYVYSTFEYAMIKLPYEIAQGALGAVLGMILCYRAGIHKLYNRFISQGE